MVDSSIPYSVAGRTSADVAAAAAKDENSVLQFGLNVSPFDSYILSFIFTGKQGNIAVTVPSICPGTEHRSSPCGPEA